MITDIYDVWFTAAFGAAIQGADAVAQLGLSPREIYEARDDLGFYPAFTKKMQRQALSVSIEDVEIRYAEYVRRNVQSVNFTSPEFPRRMTGFDNMPLVLYYKGDLSLLSRERTVSVIGSRRCSGEGEDAARKIAAEITEDGGVVIAGLRQGVDTYAHRACTENGGHTVAFLGTPVTQPYPKRNEDYQHFLEANDLVVSEYIPKTPYYSTNFISRNRLIRAAGDALCVIQATFRSGSLATVSRAEEMGKPVYVTPGSIFSENYEGSNDLLYENRARAVWSGHQIMAALGVEKAKEKSRKPLSRKSKEAREKLPAEALKVLNSIDGSDFSSEILRKSGVERGSLRLILSQLEVEGYVVRTANGEYIRK